MCFINFILLIDQRILEYNVQYDLWYNTRITIHVHIHDFTTFALDIGC